MIEPTLMFNKLTREDILSKLELLDSSVSQHEKIVLCGTASRILADTFYRGTTNIDFAILPTKYTISILQLIGSPFDLTAVGVIGLLDDYTDRLLLLDHKFEHLSVYLLSYRDWIVSKLNSNKVRDVLDSGASLEDLYWVADNLFKYASPFDVQAKQDLDWLTRRLELNHEKS